MVSAATTTLSMRPVRLGGSLPRHGLHMSRDGVRAWLDTVAVYAMLAHLGVEPYVRIEGLDPDRMPDPRCALIRSVVQKKAVHESDPYRRGMAQELWPLLYHGMEWTTGRAADILVKWAA